MKYNLNQTIKGISQLQFAGNVIPHKWYQHIKFDNGKVDLLAVTILAEIVYWYRPKVVKDEITGQVIEYVKKFKNDMLQRSIGSFAKQFGFSHRQVSDSLKRLEQNGFIVKEQRTIESQTTQLGNVLFLAPVVEKLIEIQSETPLMQSNVGGAYAFERSSLCAETQTLMRSNVGAYALERGTYTKNTTEITTKITAAEKAGELGVEQKIVEPELQKQFLKTASPDTKLQSESQPDADLLQIQHAHSDLQTQPRNLKEQLPVKPNLLAAENKNNKILPFQKSDALIGEVLTENQTRQVHALVREVQADFQQHTPQELEDGITFDLLSPATYTQAGNLFAKKFNTIRKQIREGAWSVPAEIISHQQKVVQQIHEDVEIKLREARGDIMHWQSFLKLAEAKGAAEEIERQQELLRQSVEKYRQLETQYQQIANA